MQQRGASDECVRRAPFGIGYAPPTMPFEFAGATDVGRKRDHNEDSLLLLPEHRVAVVCDGMGGHEAGEVASGIGVDTVKRFFEIANFQHKNVITRALGMAEQTEVDVSAWDLEPGDVCVVCCDGLTGMLTDDRIAEVIAGEPELQKACQQLIDEANGNGGVDNITVALARFKPA